MNLIEMDGFLRGKCLPGDMKVNETNAEYLVRKFAALEQQLAESQSKLTESDRYGRQADITIENLECRVEQLAAKGKEVVREASLVYSKYNDTQMPDRDIVDMQTLQEMHDLCTGATS